MLRVYKLDQSEDWDSIVRSFDKYDTYWLSGYVKAFEIHGDGEPLLFYYEESDTRGINVVMKRDVSKSEKFNGIIEGGSFFDLATPYGYGGWIIEGSNSEKLFNEYEKWCKTHSIISEFVRFHPIIANHIFSQHHYKVVGLGNTISLDLSTPDVIWANITSKNRNVIRKAIKNGVQIYNGRYPQIFEEFRKIYNDTMDKDNADSYYYFAPEFYSSICDDLKQNAQVFLLYMKKNHSCSYYVMCEWNDELSSIWLSGRVFIFSTNKPAIIRSCIMGVCKWMQYFVSWWWCWKWRR